MLQSSVVTSPFPTPDESSHDAPLRQPDFRGIDDRGIGGPPAYIARPFVKISVYHVDHVQRQIGETLALLPDA